jgi:uncharacterized SAM-binding protein YcdF (DUF218 family)
MFIAKKMLTLMLMPLSICAVLIAIGVLLIWRRKDKAGKLLVMATGLLLFALSYDPLADCIIAPLENRYPPLTDFIGFDHIQWVVVLGGGQNNDPRLPPSARISLSSQARLIEGIRIQRALPQVRLLLSGGSVFDARPEAENLAAAAAMLGVRGGSVVLENDSRDTGEQAEFIRRIVRDDPLILVTSAAHMPRAMALFEKQRLNPLPAPADFTATAVSGPSPQRFFPRAGALRKVEHALHEYLGLLWLKVSDGV